MKYFKRANLWKASNVTFSPEKIEATSYDWWVFVKVIEGKTVFNSYRYSNTTSRHQFKVRNLMREQGIEIDVTVSFRPNLKGVETLSQLGQIQGEQTERNKIIAEAKRQDRNRKARERAAAKRVTTREDADKLFGRLRLVTA